MMTGVTAVSARGYDAAWYLLLSAGLAICVPLATVQADDGSSRLTAPQIFPDSTVAYLRIDDVRQLRADRERSSYGRMSNDEQLKPIITEFYGSLVKSTEELMGVIGLNLDEILSIPSGELAIAVLPKPKGRARAIRPRNEADSDEATESPIDPPITAILIDAGEDISGIHVMLQRMDAQSRGEADHLQKNVDRLTLHCYQNRVNADQQFAYFVDRNVLVACSSISYVEDLAAVWLGQAGDRKTLADNPRFTSIMTRCVGTEGERPQLSFYLDPLAMLREMAPPDPQTMIFLAMLPTLGLDGLEAIGGSWIVAPPDFDSIGHIHVLIRSPRRGVLGLLLPKTGKTQPEDWVPDSVASYTTLNWDIQASFQAAEQLYNQFMGAGAFERDVLTAASGEMGLDFRADVINNLDGRISILQGYVRPITVNSRSNLWAVKLKNVSFFETQVLPKLLDQARSRGEVSSETIGKLRTHVIVANEQPRRETGGLPTRPTETCLSVLDNYVLISDSRYLMRQLAESLNDASNRLNQSLEYQLVADRITAQLQGKSAVAITFNRPDQSLELFYELMRDSDSRQLLGQLPQPGRGPARAGRSQNQELRRSMADSNPMFQALNAALDKHQLPPFAVLSKYLAPSGGFLVEEETGLHYTTFTLQRE